MELDKFPIQVRFPIAWGEMDPQDHVNNVYYFRYFENARMRYFEEVGLEKMRVNDGVATVLAEQNCKYFKSLKYPEWLTVGARTKSIGKTSFIMEYIIAGDESGVAALGEGVLVVYDYQRLKKTAMPDKLREAILKVEKGSLFDIDYMAEQTCKTREC